MIKLWLKLNCILVKRLWLRLNHILLWKWTLLPGPTAQETTDSRTSSVQLALSLQHLHWRPVKERITCHLQISPWSTCQPPPPTPHPPPLICVGGGMVQFSSPFPSVIFQKKLRKEEDSDPARDGSECRTPQDAAKQSNKSTNESWKATFDLSACLQFDSLSFRYSEWGVKDTEYS